MVIRSSASERQQCLGLSWLALWLQQGILSLGAAFKDQQLSVPACSMFGRHGRQLGSLRGNPEGELGQRGCSVGATCPLGSRPLTLAPAFLPQKIKRALGHRCPMQGPEMAHLCNHPG